MNYYQFEKELDSGFDGLRNYVPPTYYFNKHNLHYQKELELTDIRNMINLVIIPYTTGNKKLVFIVIADNISLELMEMYKGERCTFDGMFHKSERS